MLGKLIRHEWRDTCRIGGLMAAATALVTFFGWLAFQSPMWRNLENNRYSINVLDIVSIFAILMYVLMLAGVLYGMMIYLGVHFYRTMYTDQGYLTHTLPVTKNEILAAKILISGLWLLLLTIAVLLSGLFLTGSVISIVMLEEYSFSMSRIFSALGEMLGVLQEELGLNVGRQAVMMIVMLFFSPFFTVTILFGAVSMGQLFSKFRVLMAIVCYIALMVVQSLIGSLFQNLVLLAGFSNFGHFFNAALDCQTIVSLLLAAAMYAVSWFVASRRLNME